MYSKLKQGTIIIENPIEDYSPDWAVVYKINNEQARIYLIVETKWEKEWEDLSDKEQTKIICAKKHFETINENIKYFWTKNEETFNTFVENETIL